MSSGRLCGLSRLLSPDAQDWQSLGPGSGRERAQGGALPRRPGGPGAGAQLRGQPPTRVNSWATPTADGHSHTARPFPADPARLAVPPSPRLLAGGRVVECQAGCAFNPIPRRIPFRALGRGMARNEGLGRRSRPRPLGSPHPGALSHSWSSASSRGALVKVEEEPRHCPQTWESAAPPLPPPPERWAGIED